MFFIICEKIPDRIRGELSRFCYELKPYAFVSNSPANTRNYLWNLLENEAKLNSEISAMLIYSDKKEQGFSVKTIRETTYKINDFDGVNLITKVYNREFVKWEKYYAKPDKLLHTHLIECGVITEYLCNTIFKNSIERLSTLTKSSPKSMKEFICTLASLHDIGKMHREFQAKLLKEPSKCEYFRHEIYSEFIVRELLGEDKILDTITIKIASKILSCHHQSKKGRSNTKDFIKAEDIPDDVRRMYSYITKLFPYKEVKLYSRESKVLDIVASTITNMIVLSDWLASNTKIVGDLKTDKDFKSDVDYMEYLYEELSQRLEFQYIREFDGTREMKDSLYHNIFNKFQPNNIQRIIQGYCDNNDFSMVLIEDACGGGKTEASLYASMSKTFGGVYFAAPTTATANGLLTRVRNVLSECKVDDKVLLYTGTSYLNADNVLDEGFVLTDDMLKLTYPYVVGTIDQILMAVRKIPYYGLKGLGLLNKTIIIDEIHDVDYFQLEIIKRLLQYCKFLGIRVVMLSATLPAVMKQELLSVYGEYNNISREYPLVTIIGSHLNLIQEKVSAPVKSSISYERLEIDEDYNSILCLVEKLLEEDACICIKRNTIREVNELYEFLNGELKNVRLIKFHSEMTQKKKDEISKYLLKHFGKDRTYRENRCIVIATSVIEQSLDIDFDYGICSLSPIGNLIQFIGRIRRHSDVGTIRENSNSDRASLYFTIPSSYECKIYNESLLENTDKLLTECNGVLNVPQDNSIYMNKVWDNISMELSSSNNMSENLAKIGTIDCFDNNFHLYDYCEKGILLKENKISRDIKYEKVNVAVIPDDMYRELLECERIENDVLNKIFYEYTIAIYKNKFDEFGELKHIGSLGSQAVKLKGNFIEIFSESDIGKIA